MRRSRRPAGALISIKFASGAVQDREIGWAIMASLSRTRAMQLFTLGLNHHTAPLAIRERVAFDAERLRSALSELTAREPVKEAAILSTCNRTELYCALGEPQAALEWLPGYHPVPPREPEPYPANVPPAGD